MDKQDCKYQAYVRILKEELVKAMGCTEPIALAYCAALARQQCGELANRVVVYASGSIIKNVKSVIVPHTGHLKGIEAAVAAGIVAGDASKELEVLADITPQQIEAIHNYLKTADIEVKYLDQGCVFDMMVEMVGENHRATVRIQNTHTNVVYIEKDGQTILDKLKNGKDGHTNADYMLLDIEAIVDFANSADLDDVKDILDTQIECNSAIAKEGMENDYGANIGKVLLKTNGNDVRNQAKAYAAAGSDARMNGCEMPVVINSGSGNQGLTASVPVMVYAKYLGCTKQQLYRGLLVSNLCAIRLKRPIGTLSAYCGVVSAGAAAGAGVAYLKGADYDTIKHTLVNALSVLSGMICDGAKASCAAKIALGVEMGLFGYDMYQSGQQFYHGDGIVQNGVEQTIEAVGRVAREGMKSTNDEIIDIMIHND